MPSDPYRRRKLEVFIGSTFREHEERREDIIRAIYSAGHIPSGMELWDADSRPLPDTLRLKLKQCDVHILLIDAKFGSRVPENSELRFDINCGSTEVLSYTEFEYRKSEQEGRPIIASISSAEKQETGSDTADYQHLEDFKRRVRKSRFCKHYTLDAISTGSGQEKLSECKRKVNSLELCRHVITALNEINANQDLAPEDKGWVRADSDDANLLRQIRDNQFLKRIMDRLRQFDVLTKRVTTAPDEKSMAGEVFWRTLTGPIRRAGRRRIFFESGSTIAFLSEAFEHYVLKKLSVGPEWKVWTNNVESLLQLELHTDVKVVAFPSDAPDPKDKYGAMFNKSFFEVDEPPLKHPRRLYTVGDYDRRYGSVKHRHQLSEVEVVKETREELKKVLSEEGGGIVCVTASGLECKQRGVKNRWQIGPHTGSHPNMLFKRAAYTTGQPTVIFLHEGKIGSNFQIGKCFPVFLQDYTWDRFKRGNPVALCVGYEVPQKQATPGRTVPQNDIAKKKKEIELLMTQLGFKRQLAHETKELKSGKVVGAALFANSKFVKQMYP